MVPTDIKTVIQMNLRKAPKNEYAALKAIMFVNGKFNKGAIMREAWARARRMAANIFGATAAEFFSLSLKHAWAIAKGEM